MPMPRRLAGAVAVALLGAALWSTGTWQNAN